MWEQAEFEKHWRNEFPDGEVPVMNLNSVEDIEAELEKCKGNLKVLQQALSEEKFKVIYLQTTIAQKKKTFDIERWCNKTDSKQDSPCDSESKGGDEPFAQDLHRGSKTGKPILVPPRKKPDIPQEHPTARDVSRCVAEQRNSEQDSDREFEDVELNENFLRKNILNPKGNVRDSHRLNPRIRFSRDLDSDDGRLSPSLALRGSHGSGRSTPDGYLSSDHDDSSVGTESNMVVSRFGKKDFVVPKGLNVCFLTDSMCRGLDQYCEGAHCWVHPGTTLVRSAQQHVYHLRRVNGDALLIIHIGTNDVASGVSAETVVNRMALLVERLRHSFKYKLRFAICSVLPRYVDDKQTKHIVKRCNMLLERWCSEMDNVVFLRTWRAFVSGGCICSEMFRPDGLHLNVKGKERLFQYFKHFLWNFCNYILRFPNLQK